MFAAISVGLALTTRLPHKEVTVMERLEGTPLADIVPNKMSSKPLRSILSINSANKCRIDRSIRRRIRDTTDDGITQIAEPHEL